MGAEAKSSESQVASKQSRFRFRPRPSEEEPVMPEKLVGSADLSEVARQIEGFSGREISKLFTALQTHILYSNGSQLDKVHHLRKDLIFDVVKQKVSEHSRTRDLLANGYEYVHNEAVNEPQHPKCSDAEASSSKLKKPRIDVCSGEAEVFHMASPKTTPKSVSISESLGLINSTGA